MNEEERKETPIPIEIGEKESEGVYTNFFLIAHSSSEFIIDCARILPGLPKAKVFSRIVTTPQHARLLLSALEENIRKYEERFGKIRLPGKEESKTFGF